MRTRNAALSIALTLLVLGPSFPARAERGHLPPGASLGAAPAQPAHQHPPDELPLGTLAQVRGTGDAGLRVRATPTLTAAVRTVLPEGAQVQVLDRQVIGDGTVWYRVRYDEQGRTGWVVGHFLVAAASPARPEPTRSPGLPQARLGMTWGNALVLLLDPCLAVRFWYRQQPDYSGAAMFSPGYQMLLQTSWKVLLPVLHRIAIDPALDNGPQDVVRLIDEQLTAAAANEPVLYSAEASRLALQDIEAAAELGLQAVARGDYTVPPGWLLLAAIWSDPDRRTAWRVVAYILSSDALWATVLAPAVIEQGWLRDGEVSRLRTYRDVEQYIRCAS